MSTSTLTEPVSDTSIWPAWFQEQQSAALADYENTPQPTRKDEPWRFSNIPALDLSSFQTAESVSSEGRLINASQGVEKFSAKLVFGNTL